MSIEVWDLTQPAHDPDFPKPRGLLPVPPEVQEAVSRAERRHVRQGEPPFSPETTKSMTDQTTLHYYYEGTEIAYRITPEGVEVLAVGGEEVRNYLRSTPADQRRGVEVGPP
jgi:hypothetical protein